jgi:hypothetical protein
VVEVVLPTYIMAPTEDEKCVPAVPPAAPARLGPAGLPLRHRPLAAASLTAAVAPHALALALPPGCRRAPAPPHPLSCSPLPTTAAAAAISTVAARCLFSSLPPSILPPFAGFRRLR